MKSAIAYHLEQLRDIFYGRETYNDDEEWIDNIKVSLDEACEVVGVDIIQL